MRQTILLLLVMAVLVWVLYGWLLLAPTETPVVGWLAGRLHLAKPANMAELGDSFGVLNALFSSIALTFALAAILIQSKHQAAANVIGFSARQQFLLAECDRLEMAIQNLKSSNRYEPDLLQNMADKKRRYLAEVNDIDARLKQMLSEY